MVPASQLSASGVRPRSRVHARYRPLFVIGRGGMGTVEVAVEKKDNGFRRIVALKRLLPETSDARHTEMFLREARLAALLSHPNVVHAFDFGEEEGELFLAMEYVEGASLGRVLSELKQRNQHLPIGLVAHVLAMVCEGLSAVHELKDVDGTDLHVIHRDVSPQNVMISFGGHVKLLDFGVAKIERDQALSRTGEVKGKVSYMSPEQALGDQLDGRSDLFAVGAMLYEAVTGTRMWGDGTEMEVLRKLALESPPKLVAEGQDVPPALITLYERLVARKAEDRPASAREVADAFAEIAKTEGTPQRTLAVRMTELFGDDVDSRRKELAARLDETVPEEDAKALRESLEPPAPPPSQAPTRELAADDEEEEAVDAPKRAAPSEAKAAEAPAKPGSSRALLAIAAVAVIGLVGWRLVGTNETTTTTALPALPTSMQTSTSTPTTTPTSTSTSPPTSPPTLTMTSTPTMAPTASSSVRRVPIAGPSSAVVSPRPGAAPPVRPPASAPAASDAPHARAVPSAKPLDVDPHPF